MGDSRKICLICKDKFLSYKLLGEHLQKKHNIESYKEYYDFYINNNEKKCPYCDNEKKFDLNTHKYRDTCGDRECIKKKKIEFWKNKNKKKEVTQKTKNTKRERYNDENYNNREKNKKTIQFKYGVDNIFQLKEIKEQNKQTHLKKLGVDHPSKSESVKKSKKNTMLNNHGVEYVLQSKIIQKNIKDTKKERYNDENYNNSKQAVKTKRKKGNNYGFFNSISFKKTMIDSYGVDNPQKSKKIKEKRIKKDLRNYYKNKILKLKIVEPLFSIEDYKGIRNLYKWKCFKCNNIFEDSLICGHIPRCPTCYPISVSGTSLPEKELVYWLENIIKVNNKKSFSYKENGLNRRYELDIFIPSKNIGIELNGLYYHCENGINKKRDKHYHLTKTNFFLKRGIKVIHIWDNEWFNKQDIVKSLILSKLNMYDNIIYARKCKIKEINSKEANIFLEKTHLQGKCKSSINIGLFYEGELIQILSFGKPRFNKKYDYELIRFSSKLNTSIVGGFSKLLKYFKNNYRGAIITYADLRYSLGEIYIKNNFKLINISKPNYFYTKNYIVLENRLKYQKHKLKNLLKEFDPNLTEWENMQLNGYDRVWDWGNMIFVSY